MSPLLDEVHAITNDMLIKAKAEDWDSVFELEKSRLKIFQKLQAEKSNLSQDEKVILQKIQQSTELIKNLASTEKDQVKTELKIQLRKKSAKQKYDK